jgi:hypothetical protein
MMMPALAMAGEAVTSQWLDTLITGAYLTGMSLLGWAAAALPSLAKWVDGSLETRLTVIQGIGTSLLAGVLAYLLALVAGQSEMMGFIAAGLASFAGRHWLMMKAGVKGNE